MGGAVEIATDLDDSTRAQILGIARHAFDVAGHISAGIVATVAVLAVWLAPR